MSHPPLTATLTADWSQKLRGRLREQVPLKDTNWFQVGGAADMVFKPEDAADLAEFFKVKPPALPVTILGVGSNIIIRDGGIEGVVLKLGRHFATHQLDAASAQIKVGAAMLDIHVATIAADAGIAGFEFLSGVPGTIGGAVKMNAGAYGRELAEILVEVELVLPSGEVKTLPKEACGFSYRHSSLPAGAVVTAATLQGSRDAPEAIHARMVEIQKKREETQPIRSRTGGSTFKNPEGHKAWELVDKAGCRGLTHGGAQVSEKHCNFMINTGTATANDLELLGEEVIKRVYQHSGITLEWEIKRIGRYPSSV